MTKALRTGAAAVLLVAVATPVSPAGARLRAIPRFQLVTDGGVAGSVAKDGVAYFAGGFTRVGYPTGPGLLVSPLGAPLPAAPLTGTVVAVVPSPAGGWYVVLKDPPNPLAPGTRIVHLTAAGRLDRRFNPRKLPVVVTSLAVAQGKVLAGGFAGSHQSGAVTALDAVTGAQRWQQVTPGTATALGNVYALAVDHRQQIVYVGGYFGSIGGQARARLAALSISDGTVTPWRATAPQPGDYFVVRALAVSPDDGTLYVGGSFSQVDGQPRDGLAALDASTGTLRAWYPRLGPVPVRSILGGSTGASVQSLVVSGDGRRVYAGGSFVDPGINLAAFDASTGAPTGFRARTDGDQDYGRVDSLALSPDGHALYAAGPFLAADRVPRNDLAAFDATSGQLMPWNPHPLGSSDVIATSPTGEVYIGGDVLGAGRYKRCGFGAISLRTGHLLSWQPRGACGSPVTNIGAIAPARGGRAIYVSGQLPTGIDPGRGFGAEIDLGTGRPMRWHPRLPAPARQILPSPDGHRVYVNAGYTHNPLKAVAATTGRPIHWVAPIRDATVESLAISPDSRTLYAGGYFIAISGRPRAGLAALSARTGRALGWNPRPRSAPGSDRPGVNQIIVSPSGRTIYLFGRFDAIGGQINEGVAAVSARTGRATPWQPSNAISPEIPVAAFGGGQLFGAVSNILFAINATTGVTTILPPADPFATVTSIRPYHGGVIATGSQGLTAYSLTGH